MEILITNLVLLGFVLLFVFCIIFLWLEIQKQKRSKSYSKNSINIKRLPSRQANYNSVIKSKLIQLLHGDRQAVERLIKSAKIKQPGKSLTWYEEKVLHDLERDRR